MGGRHLRSEGCAERPEDDEVGQLVGQQHHPGAPVREQQRVRGHLSLHDIREGEGAGRQCKAWFGVGDLALAISITELDKGLDSGLERGLDRGPN